jgi:hypothetical protein
LTLFPIVPNFHQPAAQFLVKMRGHLEPAHASSLPTGAGFVVVDGARSAAALRRLKDIAALRHSNKRGSDMQRYANEAIEKLARIERLWEQLRGTKTDTPEYKRLVNEIGVLSMEYQKLAEAGRKLEEQK